MDTNRTTLVKKVDSLSLQEVKAIFLVLLHGLWVAKRELGFSHEDLNTENIMLIRRDARKGHLVLVDTNITIENMYWYPKIIDFGLSKTKDVSSGKDLIDIKSIFMGLWKNEFETILSDKSYERATNNYKSIPDIWASFRKWFETKEDDQQLKITFSPSEERINTCYLCSNPAKLKYNNTVDKYTFCGERCINSSFKKWLPLKKF